MAPRNWRSTKLGDITVWTSGGTPRKSESSYWGGSIPWISASSMKSTRLTDSDLRITEAGLKNGSRLAERNSVLLLVRGSELHKRIPIGIAGCPVAFNQDVKAMKAKDGLLPAYLLYWLLGNEPLLLSKVEHTGIGAGKLDTDVMKGLLLHLPPVTEQYAITSILGSLDDKIELNRRMNETLEEMARALFKSWFVDFDPVHAKMEGRQPAGMDEQTAALFPDSFEDSPLGEIPAGWGIGTLADYTDLNPESWSRNTAPSQITYVDLANTKWGRIEATQEYVWEDAPSRAQRILRPGDTIVGTVRPGNGSFSLVAEEGLTGSTGFAVLRPYKAIYQEFVYLTATSPENIERLSRLADGAAYPAVRPGVLSATQSLQSNEILIERFSAIVRSLMSKISASRKETSTLAAIRDALLPKLLSGEVRVAEVEEIVEDAI